MYKMEISIYLGKYFKFHAHVLRHHALSLLSFLLHYIALYFFIIIFLGVILRYVNKDHLFMKGI